MKELPKGSLKVEVTHGVKTSNVGRPRTTPGQEANNVVEKMKGTSPRGDIEAAPKSSSYAVSKHRQITPTNTVNNYEIEEELYIRRLLARRSFHLPHHNWFEDWIQFIKNNHTLLGMCMYHPLHPLQIGHRLLIFIGSVAFGLTATNSVYLWYAYSHEDMNKILVEISLGNIPIHISDESIKITYGMVTLWTCGSMLHSLFDISMWFLTACTCFLEGNKCGKYSYLRSIGSYLTIAIVAVMVACSSFVVASRAIYESKLSSAQQDLAMQNGDVVKIESFSFLLGYGIESLLVYFVYYPLFVTIGFSGALQPCFRCLPFIKFLGGRPQEVSRQLEERIKMRQKRHKLHSASFDHADAGIIVVQGLSKK